MNRPVYGPSNVDLIAVSLGSVYVTVTSLDGVVYCLVLPNIKK